MENNITQFNDDDFLFLRQPPRIMGLSGYFMEPPNDNGGTGFGGDSPMLREVYNLRTSTQSTLTQFKTATIDSIDDLQKEVVQIRKSVVDIDKLLNKSIKAQQRFQEEQVKRQKLADRLQKQVENKARTNRFRTPSFVKRAGRVAGGATDTLVGGIIDTLFPGLSRMGGTHLVKQITGGTVGIIGALFGSKFEKNVQKQVKADLSSTIGTSTSPRGKALNLSNIFKHFNKMFGAKQGGRAITADVLDEAGNVVGQTTATIKETKKVGLIGRMFGKASDFTKGLFRSFNKNMIVKPSTALSTSVRTAGTGLVKSFGTMGKTITEVATKGMTTAMRGLGQAVALAGRALIGVLSNPIGLASVLALAGLGFAKFNFDDYIKNPDKHPVLQKVKDSHPVISGLLGLGTSEEYQKKHPILNKIVDRGKSVKDKKGVGLPEGVKAYNVPGVGKDVVAMADLALAGDITNPAMSQRDKPYVARGSAQGLKLLDTTLSNMGLKFMYTSAMGGHDPKSGHGRGRKVDLQTRNRVLTPAEYTNLFNQGFFGGTTGAIGYEYGGKRTLTSPAEYKKLYEQGKVSMSGGGHYDFSVAMSGFTSAINKATTSINGFTEATANAFNRNNTIVSGATKTMTGENVSPDEALRRMAKKASSYKSTASGMEVYKTQMERQADPNATITQADLDYGTRRVSANQYTTQPFNVNANGTVTAPDINMGILELIQTQLQG